MKIQKHPHVVGIFQHFLCRCAVTSSHNQSSARWMIGRIVVIEGRSRRRGIRLAYERERVFATCLASFPFHRATMPEHIN